MRKRNGVRTMLPNVIEVDKDTYLLENGCISTDDEYYEDRNNIESVFFSELVVESGDDVVITINHIDKEIGATMLDVCNVSNNTIGYVTLRDTYLSDDRRYYALHHITDIFRQQGLSNVCCYWYLCKTKEEIEDYYDMMQGYIDLED